MPLQILLILFFIISIFFTGYSAGYDVLFPDNHDSDGTIDKPFLIGSESDLRNLSQCAGDDYYSKYYLLTQDIDLENNVWTPIGNADKIFTGTFDGNGFRILNLNIDSSDDDYKGLFGYAQGAVIKNLRVSGNICGRDYVGFIAGYMDGGSIQNCMADGNIISRNCAGGLVGRSVDAKIINSCFIGEINGSENVGGITGRTNNYVVNCYCVGNISGDNIVGGIIGYCAGSGKSVTDSISLLKSIDCKEEDVGRIAGNKISSYNIINTFAFGEMEAVETKFTNVDLNGDSISKSDVWNNSDFFTDTLLFSTSDWKMNCGNPYFALPIPKCLRKSYEGDASYLAPVYDIRINQTDGGDIYADKTSSIEGLTINLRNIPDANYRFLKYEISDGVNADYTTENSFSMPPYSVTVSAEFELIPIVTPAITNEPTASPTPIVTESPAPTITNEPTASPTTVVTQNPAPIITNEPTVSPTTVVTENPTVVPTKTSVNEQTENTDSGSGNYQYYPRFADSDNNKVDFGTSPVVESLIIPEGTSGIVILNTKPDVPESFKDKTVFEITAPDSEKFSEIYFRLPSDEISSDNEVILCRISDEKTEKLKTSLVNINGDTAYFKAETNKFGLFVITFDKKKTVQKIEALLSDNSPPFRLTPR